MPDKGAWWWWIADFSTLFFHTLNKLEAYLAVEECDDVVVVQLGELLEDLDLLAKQVLALRQVLLRDRLDRHHVARRLRQKKKISFILNSK